jgi:hypothetical protein
MHETYKNILIGLVEKPETICISHLRHRPKTEYNIKMNLNTV